MVADPYSDSLGIEVLEAGTGRARAAMTAGVEHTNFLGIVHGGAVFSLADAALAAASNSFDHTAVATTVTVHLLRACRPGDRLVAEAVEEHRSRRLGLYRITVRRHVGAEAEGSGELVAMADGQVAIVGEP